MGCQASDHGGEVVLGLAANASDPRDPGGAATDQRGRTRDGLSVGRAAAGSLLLEREAELGELEDALDGIASGVGHLVVLEASAGLGKSSLLEACRCLALGRGFGVVSGRASELEREIPFGVVVQLFEQRLSAATKEQRARLLSGSAAVCGPLFERADGEGLRVGSQAPGHAPHGVLHGLYWLCANLSTGAPLVVMVDDAHWADAPSRLFLSYLLRRLEGLRVLVAVALRPPAAAWDDELSQEIIRAPGARVVRPGPLSHTSVAALVRERLSGEASERFVRACGEVTLGNPLFLRELLLELAAREVAVNDAGAQEVRGVGPGNVSRMVLRRVARLPAEARALARAVAVLDERAELRYGAALCGLALAEAADAADSLARVELLAQSGGWLRFVHPIARAAIYAEMSTTDRSDHHACAARLLAADQAPADQVAAHLVPTLPRGDQWVVRTLRSAAGRALSQGTPGAAISYLRRALDEPPASSVLPEILGQLGAAESRARDPRALEHLKRALELTDAPDRRALIALDLGRALMMAGRSRDAVQTLIDASAELDESYAEPKLQLEAQLLEAARVGVRTQSVIAERLESLRGRVQGQRPAERVLLANLAYEEVIHGGQAAHAAELATRALGAGALLSEEGSESMTYYYAVWTLALCDRLTDAAAALDAAIADARVHGSAFGFGLASCFRSNVHYRSGMLLDAEADARAALTVAALEDLGPSLPLATAFLTEALLDRGELEQAAEALAHVDAADPDSIAVNPMVFSRARLRLLRGDVDQSLSDLLEVGRRGAAWGAQTPAFLPWRATAALALARLDRHDEAIALAEQELAMARAFGAPRALAIALRATGLLARGQQAIDCLAEASVALKDSPALLERARVLVDYGAALRRANQRTTAKEQLREGLRIAEHCGAVPIAEHARDELAATGARPRRAYDRDALTASERRVAQMAASGLSNREIAQALFLTEKTIEWHLGQTYRKLDVHSRHDLSRALANADQPTTAAPLH